LGELIIGGGGIAALGGIVNGTIGGIPFTTEILRFEMFFFQSPAIRSNGISVAAVVEGLCAALNLQIAPIHVELLGLHIDTSSICVEIAAKEQAGILADLLCGLADGDLTNLPTVIDFLQDILTAALSLNQQIVSKSCNNNPNSNSVCTGACEVLSLVIGPVDLVLLGVHVHIVDCQDQAVRACVSATRGEGLLGDLLCSLTD
jgi:hypothetical protein